MEAVWVRAGELLRHPLSRTLFSVPRGVGAASPKRNAQDVPACRRALGNLRFGMFATSLSYRRSVQFWKFLKTVGRRNAFPDLAWEEDSFFLQ